MRRHAAPGPPGLRKFCQRLGVRPFAQAEGDAGGFLHREIAGRESIGVAQAKQQINIGGPGTHAMQRGERLMRRVGLHIADLGQVDAALGDRLADFLDRFDFGRGQAQPLELVAARRHHCVGMKRIESREQPVADGGSAGDRQLLPAHDGAQPGIAALAAAQVEGAGLVRDRRQSRIGQDQLGEPGLQIVLAMEEVGHTPVRRVLRTYPAVIVRESGRSSIHEGL